MSEFVLLYFWIPLADDAVDIGKDGVRCADVIEAPKMAGGLHPNLEHPPRTRGRGRGRNRRERVDLVPSRPAGI